MKPVYKSLIISLLALIFASISMAQTTIRGSVLDAKIGEPLIGATLLVKGTSTGGVTDYDGYFELKVASLPATFVVSYSGYITQEVVISTAANKVKIQLEENAVLIASVEIVGQRISDKQKTSPLTVEALDAIGIKETAASSFYNGLGNLKGVDLTTASLGFTIINMRGFNSTSPVRSLQIIDGVDNQAPGLNFSLGNFLGASELDVNRVDLVAGASGPFYGPNAFNGVINIQSKNPFLERGLAASVKTGERNLVEASVRWAASLKNKAGHDVFAWKMNLFHLRANDWVADNYDAVGGSRSLATNPGGYDAVNRYGDEYQTGYDLTGESAWADAYGLQVWHRTGYNETDLVDYNTRNLKASIAAHFRTQPEKEHESPELIFCSGLGSGTTVYQGDNRFSLKNILFYQNRIEFRKKDKFFIRAYSTNEDGGDSYDPYFTALRLQNAAKSNLLWRTDYSKYWVQVGKFQKRMKALEYPQLITTFDPNTGEVTSTFDYPAAEAWFVKYADSLSAWHALAATFANGISPAPGSVSSPFLVPGTPEFQKEFDRITSTKSGRAGGTLFYDKSALYHAHGEYKFEPSWMNSWVVGGNFRQYRPYSEGTIFSDTATYRRDANNVIIDSTYERIKNSEFGVYTGIEKKLSNNRLILSATVRADKNQNFNLVFTPAASAVWTPNKDNFLRFSFSSAIRNPTLSDQYLFLNVGRATLLGNLNGYDSLVTVESFLEATKNSIAIQPSKFVYFNVAPIQPENVKTFEVGYRTTLFGKVYMDAGYYFNIYNNFIGYNIGLDVPVNMGQVDINKLQAYRVAANSTNTVTTQGFNIGLNYYFRTFYQLSGNYSFNTLNKLSVDDPIIPAFNTPKNKYNLGLSARDLRMGRLRQTGWNITYKWIQGFVFEGSPQFTGAIPTYDMVDAQWNFTIPRWHTTFKFGATNILGISPLFRDDPAGRSKLEAAFNNDQFQTYGGPRIGRMAYVSLTYNFVKKD